LHKKNIYSRIYSTDCVNGKKKKKDLKVSEYQGIKKRLKTKIPLKSAMN